MLLWFAEMGLNRLRKRSHSWPMLASPAPAKGGQGCEWKWEANDRQEERRHGPLGGNRHDCHGRTTQARTETTPPSHSRRLRATK